MEAASPNNQIKPPDNKYQLHPPKYQIHTPKYLKQVNEKGGGYTYNLDLPVRSKESQIQ